MDQKKKLIYLFRGYSEFHILNKNQKLPREPKLKRYEATLRRNQSGSLLRNILHSRIVDTTQKKEILIVSGTLNKLVER